MHQTIHAFGLIAAALIFEDRAARGILEHETLLSRNVYFDKQYRSIVKLEQLEKAPRWNASKEDFPPLSARKAISIGREMLKDKMDLTDTPTYRWEVHSASLEKYDPSEYEDIWFWLIRFEKLILVGGSSSGPPQYIEAVVLMNGECVVPEVSTIDRDDE
jgi:hypothetical protein